MAKKIIKAKLDKKPSIAPFTNALRSSTTKKQEKRGVQSHDNLFKSMSVKELTIQILVKSPLPHIFFYT